jgi:hypothetical protein
MADGGQQKVERLWWMDMFMVGEGLIIMANKTNEANDLESKEQGQMHGIKRMARNISGASLGVILAQMFDFHKSVLRIGEGKKSYPLISLISRMGAGGAGAIPWRVFRRSASCQDSP